MKRALAVVAFGLAAAIAGEARQQPQTAGLVIEAIEKGSAPDLAGLKVGDQLVSWTRVASQTARAARGDFVTPFDAREFELEHLPRSGTSITALRNGDRLEVALIPGFWGLTARLAFSGADLSIYEGGRTQLEKRPADALAAWQPLINGFVATGDRGSAAWLMTRVASSLVALEQLQTADELFDRAAALFTVPANPAYEAMVWEWKANAYQPEHFVPRSIDPTVIAPPKRIAALAAHERARSLRITAGRGTSTLAVAESELMVVSTATTAPRYFLAPGRNGGREAAERAGQFATHVLETIEALAPESFAHARALRWIAGFVRIGKGPEGSNAIPTQPQADAAARPYLQRAWPIFETVAPTHLLLRAVIQSLRDSPANDDPALRERVQRRLILFGEETGDRTLVEVQTMSLASDLARRGAVAEALALPDELLRTGSSYASLASGLGSLASAFNSRGHRDVAISILERVLDGTSPPHVQVALSLAGFYTNAGNRSASERMLTSLVAREDSGRISAADRARIYDQLAWTAMGRYDLVAAESWAQRALVEAKAINPPNPILVAQRYDLLETIEKERLDPEKAREYLRLAIEQERQAKRPLTLTQANRLLRESPTSPEAEAYFAEQLAQRRKTDPGTLNEANALETFAARQVTRGDTAGAERSRLEALALRRRLEPGSENLVRALNGLGDLARRRGGTEEALAYFKEVLALREDARWRVAARAGAVSVDGTEILVEPYANVVGLLVARGDVTAAFNVAERARGRTLVQMLRSRDVLDALSAPGELEDERRKLEAAYVQKQSELEDLSALKDAVAVAASLEDLHRLWSRLKDLDRQVAALNPQMAALEPPAPMSVTDVRARLDPGTVLLSYLTGQTMTYLFVVTPAGDTAPGQSGVVAHALPVGAAELRAGITAFRTLITWDADSDGSDNGVMIDRARSLYDALIRPAERQIAGARRLLLVADGPLQAMPFGALVRVEQGRKQFLVEWKPLHTAPSIGVYFETLSSRRAATAPGALVAFADPAYGPAKPSSTSGVPVDAEVESLLRSGGTLSPLPGTRREVSAIASLFGPTTTTYVGASATEAQARALSKSAKFIHFAVHGRLNEKLPMNSALVFATPESRSAADDGVLQAWEIFRHVRIDADLVTLSACDSGLGKEVAGEGLIGLTRAFLHAGARTVVASLWKVADEPTAQLMTRFYANLHAGQPKDQALRNAQLEMIRLGRQPGASGKSSSPAHWAAFTVTGDWK